MITKMKELLICEWSYISYIHHLFEGRFSHPFSLLLGRLYCTSTAFRTVSLLGTLDLLLLPQPIL
jgi:hypothetical protein